MTAVPNTVFTAAQFNTHVRDNLNETAPAKATQVSSIFAGNGVNSIVERFPQDTYIDTAESTSSVVFTDLTTPGPIVTVDTGDNALVMMRCSMDNDAAVSACLVSVEVSGATSLAATTARAITTAGLSASARMRIGAGFFIPLTAGSNTFTAKYRVSGNTGNFRERELSVMPL
jgi:hypothetical protein